MYWILLLLILILSNCSGFNISESDALDALTLFSEKLNFIQNNKDFCKIKAYGSDWGQHMLCDYETKVACNFLSFGISYDYSFDSALYNLKNCSGFAFDPTVSHPLNLSPGIMFLQAGANSPTFDPKWSMVSVPKFRKMFDLSLFALKMDCEGFFFFFF
jgi:hypothetical protein